MGAFRKGLYPGQGENQLQLRDLQYLQYAEVFQNIILSHRGREVCTLL